MAPLFYRRRLSVTLEQRRKLCIEYMNTPCPIQRMRITEKLEADTTLHVTLIAIDDKPLTLDHAPGTV